MWHQGGWTGSGNNWGGGWGQWLRDQLGNIIERGSGALFGSGSRFRDPGNNQSQPPQRSQRMRLLGVPVIVWVLGAVVFLAVRSG